jgi:hypothetical protein
MDGHLRRRDKERVDEADYHAVLAMFRSFRSTGPRHGQTCQTTAGNHHRVSN